MTKYDWFPGHRGWVLKPDGDKNPRHSIICLRPQVLLKLHEQGRLAGQALLDAKRLAGVAA